MPQNITPTLLTLAVNLSSALVTAQAQGDAATAGRLLALLEQQLGQAPAATTPPPPAAPSIAPTDAEAVPWLYSGLASPAPSPATLFSILERARIANASDQPVTVDTLLRQARADLERDIQAARGGVPREYLRPPPSPNPHRSAPLNPADYLVPMAQPDEPEPTDEEIASDPAPTKPSYAARGGKRGRTWVKSPTNAAELLIEIVRAATADPTKTQEKNLGEGLGLTNAKAWLYLTALRIEGVLPATERQRENARARLSGERSPGTTQTIQKIRRCVRSLIAQGELAVLPDARPSDLTDLPPPPATPQPEPTDADLLPRVVALRNEQKTPRSIARELRITPARVQRVLSLASTSAATKWLGSSTK